MLKSTTTPKVPDSRRIYRRNRVTRPFTYMCMLAVRFHQISFGDLVLQFQVDAFHVQEASGQAPKDYLQEDERQGAPSFRLEDGLEQRFSNIHLKEKGRFPVICLALFS